MTQENSPKTISRRKMMLGVGGVAATGLGAWWSGRSFFSSDVASAEAAVSLRPLMIPPLIEGKNFHLNLNATSRQFFNGSKTPTYGYNGQTFWGPTLRWKKGDVVKLNVTNHLSETTTAHWHGIHLPATADGGPHQPIAPGATWSPSFKVMNDAATYWYHPHMHQSTQKQLTMGAGGFIIIDDDSAASKKLPRNYGIDDIPLVFGSRRFKTNNAFNLSKDITYGDYLLANGVINATHTVPAQLIRFRILNAEVERYYNIGFDNNRPFYVVATDGGLLNKPARVTRLRMAPGERYEIVVDLSHESVGSSLEMKAYNQGMPFGAGGSESDMSGPFGSLLNNTTFTMLNLTVSTPTAGAITSVPATLAANVLWKDSDATRRRVVKITDNGPGTPFTFDGKAYSMMAINQRVVLNTVEAWTIKNGHTFGHSFHIHDVQFALVSRSTGPIPEYEKGWKDTFAILPDEVVTFVAKFADYTNSTYPYMYHCHMSNHEDGGLMGQFLVVKN